MAPPPAGLPITPSTPRKTAPAIIVCCLGFSACRLAPHPFGLRSRSLHGIPWCTLHRTLVFLVSCYFRYPTASGHLLSTWSFTRPPHPQVLVLRVAESTLLDTPVGCFPALDEASEGPSATLMQADIGTTHKEGGHTTVRSTFRLGTTPKRPETRAPAHPWTVDRQPPAWAIACF